MPLFPPSIDVQTLNGTNGFMISGGGDVHDWTGQQVASAGDVNGDGFLDLIIGAPFAEANGDNSGAAYVVFGKASGFSATFDLAGLNGSNGFKLIGRVEHATLGTSVASAGDVNGDGFDDIIVGAPRGPLGESYVVFGKASGFASSINASTINGSNGFRITGGEDFVGRNDGNGYSVASAGDVNGDGIDDLIVGAGRADTFAGASYVIFGQASGFAANVDLSSINGSNGFKISGIGVGDQAGSSVAPAGDVNGDGFDDVIIGAIGDDTGASYVVFGSASGFASNISLAALDGGNGFRLSGGADWSDYLRSPSVASAGDVNGDGFADIIIGADEADTYNPYSGAAYIVFGKATGFAADIDLASLNGSNGGFTISGSQKYGLVGCSVTSAGDVNGDGFDDVIIGAHGGNPAGDPLEFNFRDPGTVYVVFGKASGFANMNLSSIDGDNGYRLFSGGEVESFTLGFSVSGAGDLNGDGFDDMIVSDPSINVYAGASYVVYGVAPNAAVTRTGTDIAQTLAGGGFDDTLAAMGGDDLLYGNGGDDTLDGGEGDDVLHGGAGVDTADYSGAAGGVTARLWITRSQETGGAGLDTLSGIENLTGSNSGDTLVGNDAANVLVGLAGDDIFNGRLGADQMSGGLGNDKYAVDDAGDQVIEASNAGDADVVRAIITYTLGANVEHLALIGADAIDGTGNELANRLVGNAEANVLSGLAGDDRLLAGDGDDTLIGGAGSDGLAGGAGRDTFRYLDVTDTGRTLATRDRIADFVAGTDTIDLSAIDANAAGGTANDAFNFIGAAAFSNTAGELRQFAFSGGTMIAGDVDGDAVADFQIKLAGTLTLSESDFLL